jgi:hypothetical protein
VPFGDLCLGGDVVKAEVPAFAVVLQECAERCAVDEPSSASVASRSVTHVC